MGDELEQPVVVVTPPPTPVGDPKPEETVEYWRKKTLEWENRYNGQQGALTRITNEKNTALSQVKSISEQYEAEKATLAGQVQTLDTQVKTLATEKTQAETQLQTLNKQKELGLAIRKDYPELAPMWDQGLLLGAENLEGEALTTYLSNQKAFVESLRKGGIQDYYRGSAPPPPPNPTGAGMTMEEMQTRLMSLNPKSAEYHALEAQYLDLVRKSKT